MKIIGICGSPRKGGNTEILLKEALKGAEEAGAETELILLREKNIASCKGCIEFCMKKEVCKIADDANELNEKLTKADGFIIGSPTYFGLPSGILKNFMDRTSPIYGKLNNKPVVIITVGMSETDFGGIELTAQALRTFCLWHEMIVVGSPVCVKAEKIGEVSKNKRALISARKLGGKIVNVIK